AVFGAIHFQVNEKRKGLAWVLDHDMCDAIFAAGFGFRRYFYVEHWKRVERFEVRELLRGCVIPVRAVLWLVECVGLRGEPVEVFADQFSGCVFKRELHEIGWT